MENDDRRKRIDLTDAAKEQRRTLVHLLGYYCGDNESVLSVVTDRTPGDDFPENGRIFVGSPRKSPLLEGYLPDLGGWSCSPDAADRLGDELHASARLARAAIAQGSTAPSATSDSSALSDRPSIAELQRLCRDEGANHDADLALAAPVLLEIAAAALALREQEQVAAKARFRVYASLNKNADPSDENYATAGAEDSKLAQLREAYLAALAKVRQ